MMPGFLALATSYPSPAAERPNPEVLEDYVDLFDKVEKERLALLRFEVYRQPLFRCKAMK